MQDARKAQSAFDLQNGERPVSPKAWSGSRARPVMRRGMLRRASSYLRMRSPKIKVFIIHGPAHRGANGVAMPTDEDDQDGHFFYNHPERGAYFAA